MTTEEKRKALDAECDKYIDCTECPHMDSHYCEEYNIAHAGASIIDKWYEDLFGKEETTHIRDSGERREFATGAVRDMAEGKGDMVSIPWEAILRLSKHYEAGAKKYARWNFRKGIPVSSFIDSALRHLAKYQCGEDDEDHLSAAAFNVLGAMLMENTVPEMQDLPARDGKNTFNYFEQKEKST
jgi:hypothetical protein